MSTQTVPGDYPRRDRRSSRPHPARALRQHWKSAGMTVIALLLVVAGWSAQARGAGSPPTHSVTGLAPTAGTPIALATPSSAGGYACDFSADIPIVEGSVRDEVGRTALIWTEVGDLTLRCDGEQEDVAQISDVLSAGPVEGHPGIVFAYVGKDANDPADGHGVYLNLATGASFATGHMNVDRGYLQQTWGESPVSPYLLVNDSDGLLSVLDTRSMTATLIADIFGESIPQTFNLLSASSADGSTLALMVGDAEAANAGAFPMPAVRAADMDAPGDIVLIDAATNATRWFSIGTDDDILTGLSLSPDGSMLAVSVAAQTDSMTPPAYLLILAKDTGDVLAQSETFSSPDPQHVWSARGMVLQTEHDIVLIPTDGSETQHLYEIDANDGEIMNLKPTLDPDVVVATSVF